MAPKGVEPSVPVFSLGVSFHFYFYLVFPLSFLLSSCLFLVLPGAELGQDPNLELFQGFNSCF